MESAPKKTAETTAHRANLPAPGALWRLPEVLKRIPVARSTLWGWVRDGRFPKPIKLGPMTTAWRASDVAAWMEQAGRDSE